MGRSVEHIGPNVIYFDAEGFYTDDSDVDSINWDNFRESITCALMARYKSLDICENEYAAYPYCENRVILSNDFANISISEYMGCGAFSIYVDPGTEVIGLAEHWINQVYPGIVKTISDYCTVLRRIGTFSTGVGVFEEAG